MPGTTLAIANILVTWICTDATLSDCQIYQREIQPPLTCEQAAENVLDVSRKLKLPETIVVYCTDKIGLEDLPVPSTGYDKTNARI